MKLSALEGAFWYDKLSTDGTPDVHIPVKAEVIADWRRRLADFTQYRLPEMGKHGIDLQVLSLTASRRPDAAGQADRGGRRSGGQRLPRHRHQREHPGRFQGLVAVPLQNPRQAAAELPAGGLVLPVPVPGLVAA